MDKRPRADDKRNEGVAEENVVRRKCQPSDLHV